MSAGACAGDAADAPAEGPAGPAVLWLRRDLRLHDHPALLAARDAGGPAGVVALFVLDPRLWGPAGPPRRAWLLRSLRALNDALQGRLVLRQGDPARVVPEVAAQVSAASVHVSADAGPYGRARDLAVARALGERAELVRTGSPYAIGPGTLRTAGGTGYAVFTPFLRAWTAHGWPAPAPHPGQVAWVDGVPGDPWPGEPELGELRLPEVGEEAARRRWREFRDRELAGYAVRRDLPASGATSQLSAHLKYGELHPRTLLADLARIESGGAHPGSVTADDVSADGVTADDVARFRAELCWREFYADVLWHHPDSARHDLRPTPAAIRTDPPGDTFDAWCHGRTGYPMVDAGMRQLLAEGFIHNRVRMLVASFLIKDLHLPWQLGARWFMRWLRDGDLASNQHGWQWVAGSGTDAAPYFRVFNPVTQGLRFDPDGDYVRRYLPQLRHLPGATAHEPWKRPDGYTHGYPHRIIDHATERTEALARYAHARRR